MWRFGRKTLELTLLLSTFFCLTDAIAAMSSPKLGRLTVEGQPIPLKYAYAVSGPDMMDGTKQAFLVVLTEKPLAASAIKEADSFASVGGGSVRSLLDSGLAIEIGPDRGYHLTIRHPALKGHELQKSGYGGLKIATLGPDRVAATFASSSGMGESEGDGGPEEIVPDRVVQFKTEFDIPIERHFPLEPKYELGAGSTKLPVGGGEPGKVWIEQKCKAKLAPALPNLKDPKAIEKYLFAQGITEKDIQDMLAMLSKRDGKKVTRDEALKSMGELLGGAAELGDAMSLSDCKVLGGRQDGKVAIIQVEATMAGGRTATDITLANENGTWVVKKTGAWRSP